MSDSVKKSKKLSKVLRHDPGSAGLVLDKAGWCDVPKLLDAMRMTQEELDLVVDTNNKKRFEYNPGKTKIRASQGHSVEVDLEYEPADPPYHLWHGTNQETVDIIRSEGIQKMSRHAVHLSADKETAMTVGKRKGTPIALRIRAQDMQASGFVFYKSTNGVWLVDNVPPRYIEP